MNKYNIIEKDIAIEGLNDPNDITSGTTTEFEKGISFRNPTLLISVISGVLSFVPTSQSQGALTIVKETSGISLEACLNNYNQSVDGPLIDFFHQIDNLTRPFKYSKDDIVNEVISFRSLTEKWDGYSAIPLEVKSASNALNFIDKVGVDFFRNLDDFYPNPNGTISFEWKNDSNEGINLEIGNKVCSYYVALNSQDPLFFNNVKINAVEAKAFSEYIGIL
jgi:hypothetical protein